MTSTLEPRLPHPERETDTDITPWPCWRMACLSHERKQLLSTGALRKAGITQWLPGATSGVLRSVFLSNAGFNCLTLQISFCTCLLPTLLVCLTSSSQPNSPSTFHHFLLAADSLRGDKASPRRRCCRHPPGTRFSDLRSRPARAITEELSFRKMA